MRILKCKRCMRTQSEGKFCLDCGGMLEAVVTTNVQFKPIRTKRSSDALKRDIRTWLNRIGVQNPDIQILSGGTDAEVTYVLKGKSYTFKSILQENKTCNLAAVEQFLHYRVLGIERGIESTEQAFAGYEALPDPDTYLREMSDEQLRKELKQVHPDTGTGDSVRWEMLMAEKKRRGGN